MARDVPDLPGFNLFWEAWPGNIAGGYARKGGKAECLKLWRKMGLEPSTEEILRHVAYLKTTRQWRDTFGDYIPAPAVHLRQRRWDGADIPDPSVPTPRPPQAESARAREARERVERVAPGAAARRPGTQEPTAADWIEYVGTQITG